MLYNVLNETDYYPRDKFSPDLNPTYGDRKVTLNDALAIVAAVSPLSISARRWIGSALFELTHPLASEDDLFAEAIVELRRLAEEVRRGN